MGRFSDKVWRKEFYTLLQKNRMSAVDFGDILMELHKKVGSMEPSFSSKLVATINPEMPVIDSIVLKNLGWRLPYTYRRDRHLEIIELYKNLIAEFSRFLKTENGQYLIMEFVKMYSHAEITKTKMLDLILWQTRN